MKDYVKFGAVDFVQDEQFLKWVRHTTLYPELNRFWVTWLEENPNKVEEVEEARRMIMALLEEGEAMHIGSRQDQVLSRLKNSIKSDIGQRKNFSWRTVYGIAAAVVVLIAVGVVFLYPRNNDFESHNGTEWASEFIKEINNGDTPKTILLADGSSIVLHPHSELQYPKAFEGDVREVVLSGEGFFDISKDINRPFLVYTDKVLTKVLGTSFSIRAFSEEKDIRVKVRTGKVSVVARPSSGRNDDRENKPNSEGVLLAPNQQVVYVKDEEKFVKTLVDEPAILKDSGDFTFVDAPVIDVFLKLEEAYGVDIVFNEELMRDCLLNGSFEDTPLYDKLRLICKSVNAQYEVVDSHIVITGHGCNDK